MKLKHSIRERTAFTLVELLAVLLVILVLVGMSLGMAKYVSNRTNVSQTRVLLAKLEMAIENFRSENGYYPSTTIYRVSPVDYHAERENSARLYAALTSPKSYATFGPSEIIKMNNGTTYIIDAWGTPINYYCPESNVAYYVSNSGVSLGVDYVASTNYYVPGVDNYAQGGMVNTETYDLFSYGPDKRTSVPGCTVVNGGTFTSGWPRGWTNHAILAIDDIWPRQR